MHAIDRSQPAGLGSTVEQRRPRFSEIRALLLEKIGFVTDGMDDLVLAIDKAICRKDPILILGESGTGKGDIASAIDLLKRVRGDTGKFERINCAEFHEEIIESELFGHAKGSYTGAQADRKGLIEAAHEGRIFLDEIGALKWNAQGKILTVIEDGMVRPCGQNESRHVDVQVLAATSSHDHSSKRNPLRPDLFYRLSANVIEVPPFRERPPEAKYHLVREAFHRAPKRSTRGNDGVEVDVDQAVIERLSALSYPGNIRQLLNVVTGVYANAEYEIDGDGPVHDIRIGLRHLTEDILHSANFSPTLSHHHAVDGQQPAPPKTLNLNARERWAFLVTLREALRSEGINVRAICKRMEIQPNRFYRILERCAQEQNFQPSDPKQFHREFLQHLLRESTQS